MKARGAIAATAQITSTRFPFSPFHSLFHLFLVILSFFSFRVVVVIVAIRLKGFELPSVMSLKVT